MNLICFDLDNTLINSERANVYSYNYALRKNGYSEWKFKDLVVLFGKPHEDIVRILTKSKDTNVIEMIKRDHDIILSKKFYKLAKVKKGVRNTLEILSKKYSLAIVSNAASRSILLLLKAAGLDRKYFSTVIGNDGVSHSKPWPDEIMKAEKLMRHKARFMVGDSIYDVMAGKKAGVKTIAILSGRYSRKQLEMVNADYILERFNDLLKIL